MTATTKRRYYTLRAEVPLKAGQVVGYTKGRGYYAKTKPAPAPKPAPTPKGKLIREQLVTAELAAAKLGIHEVGGNNHGPWVKKFLAEVGLPEGYAWCDAFQSYEEHKVAGMRLPIESASVGETYALAEKLGWVVTRPLRGDLACFDFDGDGQFDDHIELVVRVLKLGPILTLQTVGGNTSSGVAGSQADGDGVFLRTRIIASNRVGFVRIPGIVA